MNLSAFLSRAALICLTPLLMVGCMSSAPNPGGVTQVWVEESGVRVLRNGQTLAVIKPKMPNVEHWRLIQNDTAIVIKSRASKAGLATIELFDINSGALLNSVTASSLYTGQPAWARGLEDH